MRTSSTGPPAQLIRHARCFVTATSETEIPLSPPRTHLHNPRHPALLCNPRLRHLRHQLLRLLPGTCLDFGPSFSLTRGHVKLKSHNFKMVYVLVLLVYGTEPL